MAKKLTTEEFIEKAKAKKGDRYDYSLVNYINSQTKIKIICKEHGEFEQTSTTHLKGCGCPICGQLVYRHNNHSITNKTNSEFISECKIIHGDKYDYSEIKYINNKTKIEIICPSHGKFEQLPNNHTNGQGCPICGKLLIRERLSLSTNEFIKRSNLIHNNKYDYSLINYKNSTTKVEIICTVKDHGIFKQFPQHHYKGIGCPKCSKKHNFSTNEIIKEFKIIHGNKYDYSKVEYKNIKTNVFIICKKHGEFKQSPNHHKNGVGCPICANQYGGKFDNRDLYVFYDKIYNLIKIGVSSNSEKRMKSIGKNLTLLRVFEKCGTIEKKLHKKYAQFRTEHIIYKDGKTEWFNLNENEIINIDIFVKSYIEDNPDYNQ